MRIRIKNYYRNKVKILQVIIITFVLPFVVLAFLSGYPQFIFAHLRCGTSPVMISPGSTFAGGSGTPYYHVKDDVGYDVSYDKSYVCSRQEARNQNAEPWVLSKERIGY